MVKRYFNLWHLKCLKSASITSSRYVFSNHIARIHYKKALVSKVMNAWVYDVMQMSWKKRLQREAKVIILGMLYRLAHCLDQLYGRARQRSQGVRGED